MTVARMSALLFGRDIRGLPIPHIAISREERDLAHAGYEEPGGRALIARPVRRKPRHFLRLKYRKSGGG